MRQRSAARETSGSSASCGRRGGRTTWFRMNCRDSSGIAAMVAVDRSVDENGKARGEGESTDGKVGEDKAKVDEVMVVGSR